MHTVKVYVIHMTTVNMSRHVNKMESHKKLKWLYQEFIISREGECLTAYTCFKCTVISTKSTPPGGD